MLGKYQVFRGETLLGVIQEEEPDFPWTLGTFQPAPTFGEVKPLFDALRTAASQGGMSRFTEVWNEINAPGMRLVPDEANEPTITQFILHIDGTRFQLKY